MNLHEEKALDAQATIDRLSHEGRGVTKMSGKTLFIENALPGEKVTFKYIKKHNKYDEAIAKTILNPSSNRVFPPCEHFSICGGCRLQHILHLAQINFKQATVMEQLQHFAHVVPETILEPLMGPIYGYRRKARLGAHFFTKKDRLLIGFHEKNGRYIADISHCAILDSRVSSLIEPLRHCLAALKSYREIPQIEIAVGDSEKAFVFRHLQALTDEDKTLLSEFGKEYQVHIYLQPGNLTTTHRIWPLEGEECLTYHLPQYAIAIQFHPQDFIQINAAINQQMVDQVIALLEPSPSDRILDLFCGLGNFTLPLARYCDFVVGVEGEETMVRRAQQNAVLNQLSTAHFYQHNLATPFDTCVWAKTSYQKILLDPPRGGAKEILQSIVALNPERIVYISCNPATLARDTRELVQQYGFKLKKVGVMDMFPQTCHVESLAVFEK